MTIGMDEEKDPDSPFTIGKIMFFFPLVIFNARKVSFHFEIDEPFKKDVQMFCVALWHSYTFQNIFIPMYLSSELVGAEKTVFPILDSEEHFKWLENSVHLRPNYPD